MESVNVENKQPQKIDRVVLDPESIVVVQKILDQVQNELGDLVQISQKDIVNFLIQERSAELTATEASKIKSEHFDIVRALKRATQEAIKAKQDGHEIQMDELLKIIQTPGVNKSEASKKPRGRRKKDGGEPAIQSKDDVPKLADEELKQENNGKIKTQISDSKSEKLQTFTSSIST